MAPSLCTPLQTDGKSRRGCTTLTIVYMGNGYFKGNHAVYGLEQFEFILISKKEMHGAYESRKALEAALNLPPGFAPQWLGDKGKLPNSYSLNVLIFQKESTGFISNYCQGGKILCIKGFHYTAFL